MKTVHVDDLMSSIVATADTPSAVLVISVIVSLIIAYAIVRY